MSPVRFQLMFFVTLAALIWVVAKNWAQDLQSHAQATTMAPVEPEQQIRNEVAGFAGDKPKARQDAESQRFE